MSLLVLFRAPIAVGFAAVVFALASAGAGYFAGWIALLLGIGASVLFFIHAGDEEVQARWHAWRQGGGPPPAPDAGQP
jgi:hypothetical protein